MTPDRDRREKTHRSPEVLPGGKVVLFTVGTADMASYDDARIDALVVATGQRKTLIHGGMNARYLASGHLIYARAGALLAVPFDPDRLEVTGTPTTVLSDVVTGPVTGWANFAVSRDGSLFYAGPQQTDKAALVWVDRRGGSEPIGDVRQRFERLQLSPDGQRVAVEIPPANNQVWVYELARAGLMPVTSGWDNHVPIWSSDGLRVTFMSNRAAPGGFDLFWQRADGAGSAERLAIDTSPFQVANAWSHDGRFLVFTRQGPNSDPDLWLWSAADRTTRRYLDRASRARVSPDGRWMAYQAVGSGGPDVYVQAFPGPSRKWPISTAGGGAPVWARDGRELYFRSGNRMMAVGVDTTPEFSATRPRELFSGSFKDSYDVAADGRFLMIKEEPQPASQLHVILNWMEGLKQRVPTR